MADVNKETFNTGDSEDDSEEELEEPKLKYERLGNEVTDILKHDAASCMAVHDKVDIHFLHKEVKNIFESDVLKFVALGTHFGKVFILDVDGNKIREFSSHTVTVNQISLDMDGEYIASCSDEGKVFIHGLYSSEANTDCNFDSPIKAVALHPEFGKIQSRQYITGSDKLYLCERGWLGKQKLTVLHQGEGIITTIKWRANLIAWANSKGVKMYDMNLKQRITTVSRDNTSLRPEIYPCSLCWKDDLTLFIGWADTVKICVVKERVAAENRDLPRRYVEIAFQVDFFVSGIAPLGNQLVVLSYMLDESTKNAYRPQLRILQHQEDSYEETSCDALSIRGYHQYRCCDYHLAYPTEELMYYIVSPRDVVVAKERDQDDHIAWLLETKQYQEALLAAEVSQKSLKRHNVLDIGRAYISHLLTTGESDTAGRICQKVLGKNMELWEDEVYKFKKVGQLKAISRYLPRGDLRLRPAIYEMILNEFLYSDIEGFASLIREWPGNLYNNLAIVKTVIDKLNRDPNNPVLLKTLAELYTYDQRYDKALAIYLRLKHEDVFELIHKHNLFSAIQDKIPLLMDFDKERAAKLLLDNEDKIPITQVVTELKDRPELQHVYLHKLFQWDPHKGDKYHELQIGLYAEYDRPNLLPFLRNSIHCPLQKALEICQQRHFIEETVFLLSRMGNSKQALRMITEDLNDVDKAIEFAKEQDDPELWDDLITYSIDKPAFVTGLLNNIGTHVDPIILIRRIKEGMEIPHLRDSLVKILHDYNLQISLREGCKKILVADCVALMRRLQKVQRRAIYVEEENICEVCQSSILPEDLNRATDIVVFFCHHMFHKECISSNATFCNICSAQRRGPGSGFSGFKTS